MVHAQQEVHQRAGALREFKAEQDFVGHLRRVAANQMAQVQLGHFVVAQVQRGEAIFAQGAHQFGGFRLVVHLHADKHVRGFGIAVAVVEFGDVALAEQGAEFAEAAGGFRDGDGQNGFTLFADFRPLGHKAQAVEIHVGPGGDGHQRLAIQLLARGIALGPGHGQRPGGFQNGAGVFKHILQCGADFVGIHQHYLVHQLLAQAEGFLAHLLHRHAVGKQPDMLQHYAPLLTQRGKHGIRIHRLHADDFDVRAQLLDIGRHPGNQPAAANGQENGMNRLVVLTQDFHADGALPGDDIRVVIGMDKHHAGFAFQRQCVLVGIGIGIAVQHHLATAPLHGLNLDLWGGRGHDNGGLAAQFFRRQCHALGMVARRGSDHALGQLCRGQLRHLVVRPAQLEGKHRLHVLALQQNAVAATHRQIRSHVQRGFHRHVIYPCVQNAL